MQSEWQARLRLVLALFIMIAAMPLAHPAGAQEATPLPPDQSTTTSSGDTSEQAPEQPQPTVAPTPTVVPTTAPDPTIAPTVEPTATATSESRSIAPAGESVTTDVAPGGQLMVVFGICGNDDRAGEVEYVALEVNARLSASTSYDCQQVPAGMQVDFTVSNVDSGEASPVTTLSSQPLTFSVPGGDYAAHLANYNDASGNGYVMNGPFDSKPFSIADGGGTQLTILLFVPEKAQPTPSGTGTGTVDVSLAYCADETRAGTTEFYESAATTLAAADTSGCTIAPESGDSFSLTNANDPGEVYGPVAVGANGIAAFAAIPYGSWIVTSDTTGSSSEPITLGENTSGEAHITAVRYFESLPAYVDLFVEKQYCHDDARAGSTDFLLDTYSELPRLAAADTCYAEPPFGERPELTITLDNQDTGASFRQSLGYGTSTWFYDIPAGTYVATESSGSLTIASDPFVVPGDQGPPRLRIINYYAGEDLPTPDTEGDGIVGGMLLFCTGEGRDGDVEFVVRDDSLLGIAAVSRCEVAEAISGQLTLYPLTDLTDPSSAVDGDGGVQIDTQGGIFYSGPVPGGYHVLGYASPQTGEVLSEPFAIDAFSGTSIDINVFTEPYRTGDIEVWKDFCVDPDRAGEAAFQITDFDESGPLLAAADAPDCRYSTEADGEFVFTLTNTETGDTWTESLIGQGTAYFAGIPAGTYTITEDHDGASLTSDPFDFEPDGYGPVEIYARNFIAEPDWTPIPDDEDFVAEVDIWVYTCADAQHDGGAEFFHYVEEQHVSPALVAASSSTSPAANCTVDDGTGGFSFTAYGQGETAEGRPLGDVTFLYDDFSGTYVPDTRDGTIPEGDYIVTEATTGVSTGVIHLYAHHDFDFLAYDKLPTSNVTIEVTSSDLGIADTLPADATWTVTRADGTPVGSDTFAEDDRQLPATITVAKPVTYGKYVISVDAGPTFKPYTANVTIESADQTVEVVLDPVTESQVSINVTSADPTIADTLPEGSTWTVSTTDGTPVASDTFASEHLVLPASISVENPVPFGDYVISIDGGPAFDAYEQTFTINTAVQTLNIVLTPATDAAVTVEVSSADPSIANMLPADATWTVTTADSTPVGGDTFAEADRQLPASIPVHDRVPFGEYTIAVDAGPLFQSYTANVTIDQQIETVSVVLDPVTESQVTVNVSSADPTIANTLPEDASWSVELADGTPVGGDTFAAEHRQLPAAIAVENPVPFGEYVITVSAGPSFQPYSATVTINSVTQAIDVVLDPATDAAVTVEVSSADPSIADTLPADATWTVTTADGTPVGGDTFATEHLQLPATIDVNDRVPFGDYTISVDAGPTFQPYTASVTVDEQVETISVVLEPVTVSTVSLTVVDGASPALADPIVPAGTTWSITGTADDSSPVDLSGTIDSDQSLPYTFEAAQDVPFGSYTLMLDAGENYEFYSTSITIDVPTFTFDIPLVPITESQVTINLSSSAPEIASAMPEGATWTVTLADGTPVDSAVFATGDLALPTSIAVENPVPYGDYIITIDAGPTFEPYTAEVTIDTPIQTVEVVLEPVTTSSVTLTVIDGEESALVGAQAFAAQTAATVPAGSVWTISGTADDGTDVDLSGTIDTEQPLPYTFEAAEDVPFGDYILTFDAGENYEFYSTAITIDAPGFATDIPLVPITESQVTLNLSSSDPDVADTLPEGASWTLSTTDGSYVERGTFEAEQLQLPSSVAIAVSIPYGEYLVSINGLPAFQAYEHTQVIDAPIQELDIVLDPAEAPATVTPTTEPTQTPTDAPATATVTPSATQAQATATQAPTKTAVSALPNTGQGAGGNGGPIAIVLLLVALALAALGLAASRRRWSARP